MHKRHNKSLLLYHLVCAIKYRRSILSENVELSLVEVCINNEKRFGIEFLEIGSDENHVHFLLQSVPMLSVKKIDQTIKSITAKELFRLHPEVKQQLWGGQFWSSGYYVNTVGQYANEEVIQKYISNQGDDTKEYKSYHKSQLSLFG
ncbi:IS200/IS605 family transposase [Changchengzhania lutea]|uniref:IS200/IS605 family transposase n=1 Tax=Changchengzhania lutea TaxID=2049305 RepID=UPI001FE44293|nr:IS200/IS605 family transposase [Changchengzhania lutea]